METANSAAVLTPAQKKALAQKKSDFALHTLLIVKQDDVSKSTAVFTAYCEGAAGLKKRLGA